MKMKKRGGGGIIKLYGDYLKIVAINLVCVSIIVFYGTLRCQGSFKDPLTSSPFGEPWNKFFDGWGMSHFFYFMLLGFLFPKKNTLIFIFVMGVLWELVEVAFSERPFYVSKCDYGRAINTDGGNIVAQEEGRDKWWYGRWQDIIMNTSGMLLGAWLAKQI